MSDFKKAVNAFVDFVGSNAEKAIHAVETQTKQAAKVVSEKTNDFIDDQKIKSDIRSLEKSLKAAYISLGKKVYETYKSAEQTEGSYDELYKEIESKEAEITELRKRLDVE